MDQSCQAAARWPGSGQPGSRSEASIEAAAVACYRASVEDGRPLSERKLAARFGKTSRRWACSRMTEARQSGRRGGWPGFRSAWSQRPDGQIASFSGLVRQGSRFSAVTWADVTAEVSLVERGP
jgi:hypothetical protein